MTHINIACGDSYIPEWINLDYSPVSEHISKANLLGKLPVNDNFADIVYSSHFLEHIPRNKVIPFLEECFRVVNKDGIIRLVLPDFEELCNTYLHERQQQNHEKADFLILEIIDQCTRSFSGGELGSYYSTIEQKSNNSMMAYVKERTGHQLKNSQTVKQSNSQTTTLANLMNNPKKILDRLEYLYCHSLIKLLPNAFREQNISLTSIGEKHAWMYDFYSVEKLLKIVGFIDIKRMTADTSDIPNFPYFPLDLDQNGKPRKGKESMYIEATKP